MEQRSIRSIVAEAIIKLAGSSLKKEINFSEIIENQGIENEKEWYLNSLLMPHCKISYEYYENIKIYQIVPKRVAYKKTVLFFHGGAYLFQPSIAHTRFLNLLVKKTHSQIIMPIYPKIPYHTYKETYNPMFKYYQKNLSDLITPPIIMGDSAGGGLALGFSMYLVKKNQRAPSKIILLSPWLDIATKNKAIDEKNLESKDPMLLRSTLRQCGKLWAGSTKMSDYRLSPIKGSLKGLDHIAVFVGTREIFLPDCQLLKEQAEKEIRHFYYFEKPGMDHDYPLFPIPEGKEAIQIISDLINTKI